MKKILFFTFLNLCLTIGKAQSELNLKKVVDVKELMNNKEILLVEKCYASRDQYSDKLKKLGVTKNNICILTTNEILFLDNSLSIIYRKPIRLESNQQFHQVLNIGEKLTFLELIKTKDTIRYRAVEYDLNNESLDYQNVKNAFRLSSKNAKVFKNVETNELNERVRDFLFKKQIEFDNQEISILSEDLCNRVFTKLSRIDKIKFKKRNHFVFYGVNYIKYNNIQYFLGSCQNDELVIKELDENTYSKIKKRKYKFKAQNLIDFTFDEKYIYFVVENRNKDSIIYNISLLNTKLEVIRHMNVGEDKTVLYKDYRGNGLDRINPPFTKKNHFFGDIIYCDIDSSEKIKLYAISKSFVSTLSYENRVARSNGHSDKIIEYEIDIFKETYKSKSILDFEWMNMKVYGRYYSNFMSFYNQYIGEYFYIDNMMFQPLVDSYKVGRVFTISKKIEYGESKIISKCKTASTFYIKLYEF